MQIQLTQKLLLLPLILSALSVSSQQSKQISLSLSLSLSSSSSPMKNSTNTSIIKSVLILFSFSFFVFIFFQLNPSSIEPPPAQPVQLLRIRPRYSSYDDYIKHQLNKTLNPKLRELWRTRDWDRKVRVFSQFFSSLQSQGLLSNSSRALCVGARLGQEVVALRSVGVADSVGMDLVPSPPLVVEGDFHRQPFENGTFDFEFSNVFDHALYPDKFVGEIERTLKPGGVCVLHVALDRRGDKYSANDLFAVEGLVGLFRQSELVRTRKVDGFGLDTEVVLRKKMGRR